MLKPFFVNTSGKNKANFVRRALHPRPEGRGFPRKILVK